jgi:hypothetical protein
MTTHELKTAPPFFGDVMSGRKTFECRKDDRGFHTGDTLLLREFQNREYTGREFRCKVTYVLTGGQWGIAQNYCVMAIRPARAMAEE